MSTEPAHAGANEKPITCGLVMPISATDGIAASHWGDVKSIIMEAIDPTGYKVSMVSDADDVGVIHKRIVQRVYDDDIIVCDVSTRNPNVMLELGMRLAFDKPAILIKDDKTPYMFDTSPIEHLEYPRDLRYSIVQAFKAKLREKVVATYEAAKKPEHTTFLKHFGSFVVAKLDEKTVGKDEFILNAISDMRSEMAALARRVRPESLSNFGFGDISVPQQAA